MAKYSALIHSLTFVFLVLSLLVVSGCGWSDRKPIEIGPAGKPAEAKTNAPLLTRYRSAPAPLYELEAIAGWTFEGINKENWEEAETGLAHLQQVWQEAKDQVGDMKGVGQADKALAKLSEAVTAKQITTSYENLNQFMGAVSDVGKNYKLSPVADIIATGITIRNVAFYVEDKNWLKAGAKAKEMSDNWNRIKPELEQFGIMGEVTKTHSYVNQLRDAVAAENKGGASDRIADLNKSLGRIREFYRPK
ncbi:MAG: hypothetical protein P4N59_22060 [Negativicutes bacterium]|nr:hypothetical protein [Negativicutes bacterium]